VKVDLLFAEEVYAITGRAIEVHRVLGSGYLEAVYQEAMEIELSEANIPSETCKELLINYKGRQLGKYFIADFVCYGQIIIEIKAMDHLTGKEEAQVLNYLKVTGFRVALLINFGAQGKLEWKRYIL
jgi:GxxExxY protein